MQPPSTIDVAPAAGRNVHDHHNEQRHGEPSGRAVLDAIMTGALPPPPAAELLDLDLEEVGDGYTRFGFVAQPRFGNPFSMHGGILSAIADFAVTTAIATRLPATVNLVTADLHTSFIRTVQLNGQPYQCTGRVLHIGRTQANATAEITGPDGRLHLTAIATCRILP